jgi:hypothetical protein
MDGTSKMKEKTFYSKTSIFTAAAIKLWTRPSPPPRPKTFSTREPTMIQRRDKNGTMLYAERYSA